MVGAGVSVGGTAVGGTAVGGGAPVGGTAVGWITGAAVGWAAVGPIEQLKISTNSTTNQGNRVDFLICILPPLWKRNWDWVRVFPSTLGHSIARLSSSPAHFLRLPGQFFPGARLPVSIFNFQPMRKLRPPLPCRRRQTRRPQGDDAQKLSASLKSIPSRECVAPHP